VSEISPVLPVLSVDKILKNHPGCILHEDFVGICKPLEILDITSFAHLRMNHAGESAGQFGAIATNPEFMRNYLEKSHYNADVHVNPKHCHLSNCLMWDVLDLKGQASQMIKDAADHDFKHIFTVIKPSETHVDYFHFGTHLESQAINQRYVNHLDLLESFIAYFTHKMKASPDLYAAYDLKVSMSATNQADPSLYELEVLNNLSLSLEDKMDFLDQIKIDQINKMDVFTQRELDYVPLILLGLTSKEIAKKLNISVRTAEEYTASLRNKLKARNKMDLVSKLLELRKNE